MESPLFNNPNPRRKQTHSPKLHRLPRPKMTMRISNSTVSPEPLSSDHVQRPRLVFSFARFVVVGYTVFNIIQFLLVLVMT